MKKSEFYCSQNIEDRNLIRTKLKELNFIEVKNILNEKFPKNNSECIQLINICELIYNFIPLLRKSFSRPSDVLFQIKKLNEENYNFHIIQETFGELKSILDEIVHSLLLNEKNEIIKAIEITLSKYLSPETIFEYINKQTLEINYRVNLNELDTIFKHSCTLFHEGIKSKTSEINFILREENFINQLNKKIYRHALKYTDQEDLPNNIKYPPFIAGLLNN